MQMMTPLRCYNDKLITDFSRKIENHPLTIGGLVREEDGVLGDRLPGGRLPGEMRRAVRRLRDLDRRRRARVAGETRLERGHLQKMQNSSCHVTPSRLRSATSTERNPVSPRSMRSRRTR